MRKYLKFLLFTTGAVNVTLDANIETHFRLFKVTFPFVSIDMLPNEYAD